MGGVNKTGSNMTQRTKNGRRKIQNFIKKNFDFPLRRTVETIHSNVRSVYTRCALAASSLVSGFSIEASHVFLIGHASFRRCEFSARDLEIFILRVITFGLQRKFSKNDRLIKRFYVFRHFQSLVLQKSIFRKSTIFSRRTLRDIWSLRFLLQIITENARSSRIDFYGRGFGTGVQSVFRRHGRVVGDDFHG